MRGWQINLWIRTYFTWTVFTLKINFLKIVGPLVRPEYVQLVKTFCVDFKPDGNVLGPFQQPLSWLSVSWQLGVVPNTLYGNGITDLSGSFPWALSYKSICNMERIIFSFLLINCIHSLFESVLCSLALKRTFELKINSSPVIYCCWDNDCCGETWIIGFCAFITRDVSYSQELKVSAPKWWMWVILQATSPGGRVEGREITWWSFKESTSTWSVLPCAHSSTRSSPPSGMFLLANVYCNLEYKFICEMLPF